MTRFVTLSAALFLAVPAIAQDSGQTPLLDVPPVVGVPKSAETTETAARKASSDCAGEKFVFAWGAGSNPTKVTLCSDKGATHDEVVRMLDDAASKLERTTGISEDRRTALVQQIRGKIAELEALETGKLPPQRANAQALSIPGVTPLAPIPRKPTGPVAVASSAASSALLLPKPKLSFHCYTPGDIGSGGPCTAMNRDTRITIKAGEPIPAATSLRFTRNRDFRAEVAIGPMRKGQSSRIVVPREVCGGVVDTEIEIQVARGGHSVDTRGPYLMRC